MTTQASLEHIIDNLNDLPAELQRNFRLMRDLDKKTQKLMKKIDVLVDEYLQIAGTGSSGEKKQELNDLINKYYSRANKNGERKVQLALQTHALVDTQIRTLDLDFARFACQTKNGSAGAASPTDVARSTSVGRKRVKMSLKKSKTKVAGGGSANPTRKVRKSARQLAVKEAAAGEAMDMDMGVDPNEPVYCICREVSYGLMIACDNQECPIEWFHLPCTSLSSVPDGNWFCTKCKPLEEK